MALFTFTGIHSGKESNKPQVVLHGGSPLSIRTSSLAMGHCLAELGQKPTDSIHQLSSSTLPSLLRKYEREARPLVVMMIHSNILEHELCFANSEFYDLVSQEKEWRFGKVTCGENDHTWFPSCSVYKGSFEAAADSEEASWMKTSPELDEQQLERKSLMLKIYYMVYWQKKEHPVHWDFDQSMLPNQVNRIMQPISTIELSAVELVTHLRNGTKDPNGYQVSRKILLAVLPESYNNESKLLEEFKELASESYWRIDLKFLLVTDERISKKIFKVRPGYFLPNQSRLQTIVLINAKTEYDFEDEVSVYDFKSSLGSWLNSSYISASFEHFTPFMSALASKDVPTLFLVLNKSNSLKESRQILAELKPVARKFLNKINFFWADHIEGWSLLKSLGLEGRPLPAVALRGSIQFGSKLFIYEGDNLTPETFDLFLKRFYRKELDNIRHELQSRYEHQDKMVSRLLNETGLVNSNILKDYLAHRKSKLLILLVFNASRLTAEDVDDLRSFNFISRFFWRYWPAPKSHISVSAIDISQNVLPPSLQVVPRNLDVVLLKKTETEIVKIEDALKIPMQFLKVDPRVTETVDDSDIEFFKKMTDLEIDL